MEESREYGENTHSGADENPRTEVFPEAREGNWRDAVPDRRATQAPQHSVRETPARYTRTPALKRQQQWRQHTQ